jgi:acetyl esterase/lipase
METLAYKDTLLLDVYTLDKAQKPRRPLLILVHGGGFASGKRDGDDEAAFCTDMAQKGYAVASISYRLTRKDDPFNCDCATEKKINSFVSASEDLAQAMAFLKGQQHLQFDRNKIILIGSSAGAETVLHLAYMSHHYLFKHINTEKISGVISFSGALVNASYINKDNAIPALFIHGKKDKLVPFGTNAHHFCSEDKGGYLMLDGPLTISDRLKKLNTSSILAYNKEGGHEWANKAYYETALVQEFIDNVVFGKKNANAGFKSKKIKLP